MFLSKPFRKSTPSLKPSFSLYPPSPSSSVGTEGTLPCDHQGSAGGTTEVYRALCARCAKSRPFSTTGSHGSQGPGFCTLQPCWDTRDFVFSLMLATGPRVLNSAPPMLF